MADNNIEGITKAYNDGKIAGQKWVDGFKSSNQPVLKPEFGAPPVNIFDEWYRKGFEEVVAKNVKFKPSPHYSLNIGRTRPNCIDKMLKEKGPNFIAKLGERNAHEVTNFAGRVIRDLFSANILNINKYSNLFENQKFFMALVQECSAKLYYYHHMVAALEMYLKVVQDDQEDNLAGFYNYHKANESMYQLLYNRLIDFKNFLSQGIFNPDPLIQLQREIHKEGWNRIGRDPYSRTRVW